MSTIMSLTSHGRRLGFVHNVLKDLVRVCEPRGIKVVISIQEDEAGKLSYESNDLIVSGKVELITVKKDFGPATKQVPCRLKYPDAEIIVIDDDVLIRESGLDALLRYRKQFPDAVLGFRMRKIEVEDGKLKPFIGFIWSSVDKYSTPLYTGNQIKEPVVYDDCFFEHVGVVSYPEHYAKLSEEEWRDLVNRAPQDDDVVMQVVNIRNGFKTVLIPGDGVRENLGLTNTIIGGEALYSSSGNGKRTATAMEAFADDFISYVTKK